MTTLCKLIQEIREADDYDNFQAYKRIIRGDQEDKRRLREFRRLKKKLPGIIRELETVKKKLEALL